MVQGAGPGRPPGLQGTSVHGGSRETHSKTAPRRLPSVPARVGGHKASKGGARTWGPFFRQEKEHPSHQGGSGRRGGQTWASDSGPLPLSLLSPLSIVAKRRDAEAALGASPQSSHGLRALRAVPPGLGAHPHTRPQVRGPAPGPPPNAPLRGSKDQRKNPPSPQEQHRKAL